MIPCAQRSILGKGHDFGGGVLANTVCSFLTLLAQAGGRTNGLYSAFQRLGARLLIT